MSNEKQAAQGSAATAKEKVTLIASAREKIATHKSILGTSAATLAKSSCAGEFGEPAADAAVVSLSNTATSKSGMAT